MAPWEMDVTFMIWWNITHRWDEVICYKINISCFWRRCDEIASLFFIFKIRLSHVECKDEAWAVFLGWNMFAISLSYICSQDNYINSFDVTRKKVAEISSLLLSFFCCAFLRIVEVLSLLPKHRTKLTTDKIYLSLG